MYVDVKFVSADLGRSKQDIKYNNHITNVCCNGAIARIPRAKQSCGISGVSENPVSCVFVTFKLLAQDT